MSDIDSVDHYAEVKNTISQKKSLRLLYTETYLKYQKCLAQTPTTGIVLELGSGAGFIKKYIPEAVTSDVLSFPEIDQKVDATQLPFGDESVRAIFMLNVFHHIPDVAAFLAEAQRCLKPGGRVFIIDQYPGFPGKLVLKYFHHEPFDQNAKTWKFESTGPLSGANGALAWIVFKRDREKFEALYPKLKLIQFKPHTPFRYWLCGGLKKWSLLPPFLFSASSFIDSRLTAISEKFGSFVDCEIVKL